LTLLQAYGELMDKGPEYRDRYLAVLAELERTQPENALVQASLGRKALLADKASEAATHLQHALEIGAPQAGTYADLAEAQGKLGAQNEAIASLGKAVELDPFNAVFQKKLVLRFIETKQYVRAQAALDRSLMPFSYYARLSRAQQAIYRKSDEIIEVRLPRPEDLHPLVEDLATALTSEDRALTQETTARLILGLCKVLGLPPVRVEVLAARPHARWGELHGLYTAERGRTPKIQLWMRTAKQRRVVAFRTYLRTLLHEVGHHVDYTLLRLRDSMHTEGFYKRESSLFHQLVPEERTSAMPTIEEYAKQPIAQRLERLERTAGELVAAVKGHNPGVLGRRPDGKNWAGVEVLCHLRDTEEFFQLRFEAITTMDDPKFSPATPDRWAEERQYLRNEAGEALAAFRRRREENLTALRKMTAEQWKRAGIHPARGRMSADDVLALMAWHDDNHLDQLKRALDGRP